ncbi:hypothetical protein BH11PLA2_BH11PLA2_30590 [soil metagenome]
MRYSPANPDPARRTLRLRWAILFLVLTVGCKNSQKYDLIEAELRAKNRQLDEANAELEHLRMLSQVYQSNLSRTADPTSRPGNVPTVPLKEITLGSGTGGADNDGKPGDEALQIVLVPKDDEGSAVKVPGKVLILASEIQSNGVKVPIGRWDVDPDKLRRHWRSSLLTSGFFLTLSWDKPPTTEKLRITVRYTTLDGRVFETDRDVTVKLLFPSTPPSGMPSPFTEELPPPRPAVILGIPTPQ